MVVTYFDYPIRRQEDILCLDIPVQDLLLVALLEPQTNANEPIQDLLR